MSAFLLVYSTTDGHTPRICERIAEVLRQQGHAAHVMALPDCRAEDIAAAAAVVIGASIRYGQHKPEVAAFIGLHQAALEARPNAFFSVNVVARKPGKDGPAGNPYLQKFLRGIRWRPQHLAVFAGRLDYPSLGRLDRTMIRLIMWITRGPTDPTAVVEFTDWRKVEAFARDLAASAAAAC